MSSMTSKIALVCAGLVSLTQAASYKVDLERINHQVPLLNNELHQSNFTYNYNPSYIPLYDDNGNLKGDALFVRAQQQLDGGRLGPSVMPFVPFSFNATSQEVKMDYVDDTEIGFEPQASYENYGTEDPRVVYRQSDKTYHLMYSAVEQKYNPDAVVSMLAHATSKTPWDKSSWKREGFVFPNISWSKSGALILRDEEGGPHHLIWGDNYLTFATSDDLVNWTNKGGKFIEPRQDFFDSYLVESGPAPLKLSNGNYLFFYNSARDGFPSHRPGYSLQYNVGYLILDGKDPSRILQRSDVPILTPELAWEIGSEPFLGLVPRVVFLEAAKPLGNDQFLVFYGGADSVIGSAIVTVSVNSEGEEQVFLQ